MISWIILRERIVKKAEKDRFCSGIHFIGFLQGIIATQGCSEDNLNRIIAQASEELGEVISAKHGFSDKEFFLGIAIYNNLDMLLAKHAKPKESIESSTQSSVGAAF